jgi:hypothetical protein
MGELATFFRHLREGKAQPVPIREYVATTLATFAMETSIVTNEAVRIDADGFLRECLEGK